MKADVVDQPGAPEALLSKEIPDPVPTPGQVLIEIAAFGLNRAEAVTRAGGSGKAVPFPRIIGIECVGRVLYAPHGSQCAYIPVKNSMRSSTELFCGKSCGMCNREHTKRTSIGSLSLSKLSKRTG